jgi:putative endonuclease
MYQRLVPLGQGALLRLPMTRVTILPCRLVRGKKLISRYFVYILASQRNGTLYVGVTNDLVRRMAEHKGKLVPGFTQKYGVDQLVYFEEYASILEARARERSLKRWNRAWKIALIDQWRDLTSELAL